VDFKSGWYGGELRLAADLGFMVLAAGSARVRVVGFHADEQNRNELEPEIYFGDRPKEYQTLARNAKGVGVMLGNSPESIDNMYAEVGLPPRDVGVWATPEYGREQIVKLNDARPDSLPVMAKGVLKHAWYLAHLRKWGPGLTISEIEAPYGNADLAIINPAPTWLWKQKRRGITYPVTPPLWALYRDRLQQPLERIGTYNP
jgi:hypothetical protein